MPARESVKRVLTHTTCASDYTSIKKDRKGIEWI